MNHESITRFNQPKTLSGIETDALVAWKQNNPCFNQPKTLSGIETCHLVRGRDIVAATLQPSFNQPKTLSGIET